MADVPEILALSDETGEHLRLRFAAGSGKLVIEVGDGQGPDGPRSRPVVLHPRWAADLRAWLNAHAAQAEGFTPTWERTSARPIDDGLCRAPGGRDGARCCRPRGHDGLHTHPWSKSWS